MTASYRCASEACGSLVDDDTGSLGAIALTAEPHEWTQIDDVFAVAAVDRDVPRAHALLRADGPLFSYASVIDNRSQDPICVPGAADPADGCP